MSWLDLILAVGFRSDGGGCVDYTRWQLVAGCGEEGSADVDDGGAPVVAGDNGGAYGRRRDTS